VGALIESVNKARQTDIGFGELQDVVETNDKQRFSFNSDKSKIRANQGHSINIYLGLKPAFPPDVLYHGTARRFLDSILDSGLDKRNRQHVHLSADKQTAISVGERHGSPVVLLVDSYAMVRSGFLFYLSENGVWLTDSVPPGFIKVWDK